MELEDVTLLKAWLQGLSWPALATASNRDKLSCKKKIQGLCQQLAARARFYQKFDQALLWETPKHASKQWANLALNSLQELTNLTDPEPSPDSEVSTWLSQQICAALPNGIHTLNDLMSYYALWRSGQTEIPTALLPHIKAIKRWLDDHSQTLNRRFENAPGTASARPLQLPDATKTDNPDSLDPIFIPAHLSGLNGENRSNENCRIAAKNDLDAIKSWLNVKGENPKTYQAYQKELERFLLWAVLERGKAFSSLNTDDCIAYILFIKNLQADNQRWVSTITTNKGHGHWKPFQYRAPKTGNRTTVLSLRSVNYANTVISSCMDWLVKQNYLKYNCFSDIATSKSTTSASNVNQRLFTRQDIQQMLDYAQSLIIPTAPDYHAQLRVLFILKFAFSTGLRLHELVSAKYGDIETLDDEEGVQYFLRVVGKNTRLRKTSLPSSFLDDIRTYRIALGLPPNIANVPGDEPLIVSLRIKNTPELTTAALHKILSAFFSRWHQHLISSIQPDKRLANKVKQASAHWLRHSYGSFLANDCQIPLAYIRDELGHANISTTSIYVNSDDKKRRKAVNAAFGVNQAVRD